MIYANQGFIDACRRVQKKREDGTVTDADYAELDRVFADSVQSWWGSNIIADIRNGQDVTIAIAKLNDISTPRPTYAPTELDCDK